MGIMERPDVQEWVMAYKAYLSAQGSGGSAPQPNGNPNGGALNRNGNAAATGVTGQTARTPDALSANDGVMQQARERAAKRSGRRISQQGVPSISSLTRQSKYRAGY